jgi:ribonuclease HII
MTYINNTNLENEPTGDYEDLPIRDSKPNDKRRKLTKHKKQVIWRRQKIFSLLVQVTSTYDLASALHISQSTAAREVQFLKVQAAEQLKFHIQERLPWEHKICSEGLSQIIKHAWSIVLEGDAKTNRIAALSLIAQCYKDRLEIATNAHVVTEALQHVERMKNQNITQTHATSDKS